MPTDPSSIIAEAEQLITSREDTRNTRDGLESRNCEALETIGDELTRLRAEVATLRNLFTNYLARN